MRLLALLFVVLASACATSGPRHEIIAYHQPALELAREAPAVAQAPITSGVTFSVSCTDAAAGVLIEQVADDNATNVEWHQLYCENNSATSVFYGFRNKAGNLDTSKATCISTTSSNCLRSSLSMDVKRDAGMACKVSAGTATLKCIGGR